MLNKVLLSCSIAIAFVLATTACSSADVPKNPNPPAPASTPVLAPTKTYNQLLPATPISLAKPLIKPVASCIFLLGTSPIAENLIKPVVYEVLLLGTARADFF